MVKYDKKVEVTSKLLVKILCKIDIFSPTQVFANYDRQT